MNKTAMQKFVSVLCVAVVAAGLCVIAVRCGGASNTDKSVDSLSVDSVLVDSVLTDTISGCDLNDSIIAEFDSIY